MTVEGVTYEVNWKAFRPGASIFVPCLDPETAKTQVNEVLERLKLKVFMRVCIEDGIRGLRIWRM